MATEDPLLLVGAQIITLDQERPTARAMLVNRRRIAWLGDDPANAPGRRVRTIDLTGTTIYPGFVNAHTHLTRVGLSLNAMDLTLSESLADCLNAVQAIATVTPHRLIWAGGWDETRWPEHRPPTADEVSGVTDGRPTMLTRADGHAVVVDRTSLSALPIARARGVERGPDGRPTGLLRQEAAQVAHRWFIAEMPDDELADARVAAAAHMASIGVTSAHEMGGPHRMGPADFDAWLQGPPDGAWPIEVLGYWGAMDLEFVRSRSLRRVGGSLLLDGTIGSHSAALLQPYVDRAGSGQLYRDSAELTEFVTAATSGGVQVALHAIGDRAVQQAIEVFESVAAQHGVEQLRRLGHRVEYAAMVQPDQLAALARMGVVVVLQPATDLALGDPGGGYEIRIGAERARTSNPLRSIVDSGVWLAFGADNVAALDPWAGVAAAVARPGDEALTRDQALAAATIGGRVAAHQPNVGALRPGHRADLAAFTGGPDGAGGDSPDDPDAARRCVLTMVAGRIVHDPDSVGAP